MLAHPLAKWNKALLGLVGVLCNVAYAYNVSSPNEVVAALLVLAAALGVWAVPNDK